MTDPDIGLLDRQLVWNRLLAIVEEQAQTLMRTAFSTVVREAGDLSAGVFDTSGAMLAQAVTGTPGHVNAMAASVGKFLKAVPLAELVEGDVLVTNDPWDGTGHLNDFTVVTPSHIADVGGRGFGPDANDLFEEGIRIPVCHLFRSGVRDEVLMGLIKANVRDPVTAEGDLHSLTACNELGGRALNEMMDDFRLTHLGVVGAYIIDTAAEAMAREISALPNGSWRYQMVIDGYREPVTLKAELIIEDEYIRVDFAGSSPRSDAGINVPLPYTEAYASFGVRCVIGNEVPNNAGSLAMVQITAPEGSILNAPRPSAVSARHSVGQMLPDVVLGCLAQVIPERVPAEGASCIWNPVFMNAPTQAGGNVDSAVFVTNPIFNGGTGARSGKDGLYYPVADLAQGIPGGFRRCRTAPGWAWADRGSRPRRRSALCGIENVRPDCSPRPRPSRRCRWRPRGRLYKGGRKSAGQGPRCGTRRIDSGAGDPGWCRDRTAGRPGGGRTDGGSGIRVRF
jgi:N-methylhydantoinase B